MNHDDTTNTTLGDGEDAADLQQWIDELLRSSGAAELEAAPVATHVAATMAIYQFRRRQVRRRSLAGLAAAAALAAIAAWPEPPLPRRKGPGEGFIAPAIVQSPVKSPSVENPSPNPSLRGRGIDAGGHKASATFVTGGDAIALPLTSDDPQVSIVQVYPTTTTERRWRRELVLNAGHPGKDGG